MGRTNRHITLVVFTSLVGCVQPYPLIEIDANSQLLVVDGFLNASENHLSVRLSRTVNLTDTQNSVPELHATVQLATEDGDAYNVPETGDGHYELDVNVENQKRYRLEIVAAGKKYFSGYENVGISPPIDSVTWHPGPYGITIHVNTHDAANNAQYYLWTYDETWEYRSAFESDFIFEEGRYRYRFAEDDIYHCWHNVSSTSILVSTTNRLNENIVSDFQLLEIPLRSEKLLYKYSVLVHQMAISNKAYEYWQQLKKNTESLGTLFDPQPSQITGNLTAENGEDVLGYFFASTVADQRIVMELYDLPKEYRFVQEVGLCDEDTVLLADLKNFSPAENNLIVGVYNLFGQLIGFRYSTHFCTDCILQGGTRKKPKYW